MKDIQKLLGRPNHVSQMTPYRNGFGHNLNKELKKAGENFPNKIKLSSSSQKDLSVWLNFVSMLPVFQRIANGRVKLGVVSLAWTKKGTQF